MGRQSVTVTTPVAVVKVVSSTFVSGRYRRLVVKSAVGAIRNQPPMSRSRIRANTGAESKRWKHAHSTDASEVISASEWQSLMNA